MKKYTNNELAAKLDEQGERLKGIEKQMETFNEFMVIRIDREKREGRGPVKWGDIGKQAIVALITALGVLGSVILFLLKESP